MQVGQLDAQNQVLRDQLDQAQQAHTTTTAAITENEEQLQQLNIKIEQARTNKSIAGIECIKLQTENELLRQQITTTTATYASNSAELQQKVSQLEGAVQNVVDTFAIHCAKLELVNSSATKVLSAIDAKTYRYEQDLFRTEILKE